MTDNSSDIAIPVGTFAFHSPIQNYIISFHNGTEVVGKMDFNGPQMKFTGDVDESVALFVKGLSHWFDGRLKQEREAEREACAKVCDEVECGAGMMIEERHTANECARKIRARGNDDA